VFKANAFLSSIEFTLMVLIGAVLMTGMGQLAIEMRHSIKDVCFLKEQCFFGSNFSYRCNKYGLYTTSALFFLASIGSLALNLYKEFTWQPGLNQFLALLKLDATSIWENIGIFFPLILCLIYFYMCMRSTLQQCTASAPKLQAQKRQLDKFFLTLIGAYLLRFLYQCGLDHY